jgi:iron complex outermembrane receptor protein
MTRRFSIARHMLLAAASLAALAGPSGSARAVAAGQPVAGAARVQFDIPAQSLARALMLYSRQARITVVAPGGLVRGKRSRAVAGSYGADEALRILLSGTGLRASGSVEAGLTIVAEVAMADGTRQASADEEVPSEGADILVTGTRIRGSGPVGAQLTTVNREDMEKRGYTTMQDALRNLSQASGMGAVETARPVDAQNSNLNYGRGTGVNLRGLGPDATLVLLNGRRLAPSGAGGFTDISLIPVIAIESVAVLPDGASAIYGSDAVGGVVDIVTRKRLDGVRVEADAAFGDGLWNARAAAATGLDWQSGGLVVTGEYRRSSNLATRDRPYARRDLSAVGGTDERLTFCSPGTITSGGVTYAIPAGQNGVGLSPAALVAGTANRCDYGLTSDILPETRRLSVSGHLEQTLAEGLSLFGDALYSRRHSVIRAAGSTATVTVPRSNPFFVNVNPNVATQSVSYDFARELGSYTPDYHANSLSLVGGATWDFAPKWRATAFYSYARARDEADNRNLVNTYYLARFAASNDPTIAFNPYGQGSSNSAATLNAIRGWSITRTEARQQVFNVGFDGALFDPFGAGDVKVAFGGELIAQDYIQNSLSSLSTAAPVQAAPRIFDRSDKAVFAEMVVPLVSRATAFPLVRSLTLSGAIRRDDYDDVGSTVTPKFGAEWEPVRGLRVNASWGESFKAPILSQLSRAFGADLFPLPDPKSPTGFVNALVTSIGEKPLRPETAKTLVLGVRYADAERSPFTASLSYFDIDYRNRIQNYGGSLATILTEEARYRELITRNPTAAQVAAIVNDPNRLGTLTIPPDGFGVIVDYGNRNIASLRVRGFDLAMGYGVETGIGRVSLDGVVTRTLDYETAATAGSAVIEQVGTLANPNKWKGNGAISLTGGAYMLTFNLVYVGAYRNTAILPAQRVGAWTTFDLSGRLSLSKLGLGRDLSLIAAVRNLADRKPPTVFNVGLGYDPYSANAMGRVATIGLRGTF